MDYDLFRRQVTPDRLKVVEPSLGFFVRAYVDPARAQMWAVSMQNPNFLSVRSILFIPRNKAAILAGVS